MTKEKWEELGGVIFFALGIIILFSFISYTPDDLSFYTSSPHLPPRNFIRIFGAFFSGIIFFLFGYPGYFLPIFLIAWAIKKFMHLVPERIRLKLFSLAVFTLVLAGMFSLVGIDETAKFKRGGLVGHFISVFLEHYFGKLGAGIILSTLALLSIILVTDILLTPCIAGLRTWLEQGMGFLRILFRPSPRKEKREIKKTKEAWSLPAGKRETEVRETEKVWGEVVSRAPEIKITPQPKERKEKREEKPQEAVMAEIQEGGRKGKTFLLPPLDILQSPPPMEEREIKEDLQENSRILEDTLRDFNIEAKVVRVERGPVVTLYELQPAPGVKINKIVSLSDDIALVMKASSVRVVAPLPGRGTVGVEVPNTLTTLVYLKEILETKEFRQADYKLAIALGKDIAGNPLISNLQDMPHLLIAGATGSGKTVCVNSLIMSIIFRATPEEVRFILIDPKMVELALFNGLPHLLFPVVTDAKKTALVLSWLVEEMEWRYRIFAKLGVRNIEGYN
ncbi:MAG: DNA translocase FtsK 4TM domain-containing protein, partial [Candidatus Omnitrophica bacterium]|nr:DNA translocase FtsK 4TM domain-containing protein [Candidatus Omnitrophota bacterium]